MNNAIQCKINQICPKNNNDNCRPNFIQNLFFFILKINFFY